MGRRPAPARVDVPSIRASSGPDGGSSGNRSCRVALRQGRRRYRPAAARRASARSVRSQEKSGSSRPKWP